MILMQHRADVAVCQRILDAFPRLYRGGLLETLGVRVFYAVERIRAVQLEAAQLAIIPGDAFFAPNTVRIAYSNSLENIRTGMDNMEMALAALR